MYILNVFLVFSVSFNCFHLINGLGGPSFTITAPKIVKHWTDYNVMLSLHNTTADTNVTVTVSGSNGLSESQTETLKASGIGTITQFFKMGFDSQWKNGEYKLNAVGSGGYDFTHESRVNFVNKHYIVLIQSNSPIYRPGDTVVFRVIILDDYLRPVKNKFIDDMKIYVKDPVDRKMSQFFLRNGEIALSGIYGTNFFNISNGLTNDISFQLSDEVSLGQWAIQVELTDQKQSYNFMVDRFKTPFATIDIKAREFNTYTEPIVPIKINCFYTFGKPVSGLVNILISKQEECGSKVKNITNWSSIYNISESLETRIDFRDTNLLNVNCDSTFNLTVIVEDSITNQEYINNKIIEFHQQSIVAKNLNPLQKIKPGLDFRVFIKFLNIEGNEIDVNKLNKLQFEAQIKSLNNQTKNAIPMAVVKKHNNMVLDFQTDSQSSELSLTLKLDDKIISNYMYSSLKGCQDTMIQIKLQEPLRPLNVGDVVNIIITSTESIDFLSYYFLIRGDINNASSIKFSPDSAVLMPILLTKEMAPDVTIIVYFYSSKTGKIAFDSLNLQVDGLFQNDVNIKVENKSIDVSQTAKFSIQTQPNSQLLLLGVDKAVIRDNQNNYITESSIIDQLRNIDETKPFMLSDMSKSNLVNFQTKAQSCSEFYGIEVLCDDDDEDCGKQTETKKSDAYIRRDYRKTWIWDRTTVSGKGVINLSSKIPDSITSWQLSAISLNDDKGLGIASAPIQITVFRPLFIELKLPYSMVRYEKTEVLVMIFNYLQETATIDIIVEPNTNNTVKLELDSCHGNVTALPNQIKIFKCFIMAKEIGTAELIARSVTVSKSSTLITDGEVQTVIVKYEGVVINQVKEVYLDFTNEEISNNSIKELLHLDMPSNIIDGSQKVYALTKSEIIKNNWHDLLKQILENKINFEFTAMNGSTTCNLMTVTLIQQIYQLHYLKVIDKTDESVIESIKNNLKTALASYCSQFPVDGSVLSRSFAKVHLTAADSTAQSSTWMTAFFLKSLQFVRNYLDINMENLIYHTKAWIKKQQVLTGEFIETDSNVEFRNNERHYELYLTCFVYIALESNINIVELNLAAVSYINQLYPSTNNVYDSVIACYALHVSKHQNQDQCFNDTMKKSVVKSDLRYWLGTDGKPDIETTSYGLLILVKRKVYATAFNTFKYLKSVQNEKGMIGDPIQTSIALEAMSALIKSLKNFDQKTKMIDININDGESEHSIVLKPENEITQILQLSDDSKHIDLSANGYGSAVIQIISQYNILGSFGNAFNTTVMNSSPSELYINLTVCTRYNLDGSTDDVVIEIDLPTGYKYDANGMKNDIESLDRIESINDGHVNIYLKKMESEEICLNVPAIQSFKTISTKAAPIKVYPQNDKSKLTVHELIF